MKARCPAAVPLHVRGLSGRAHGPCARPARREIDVTLNDAVVDHAFPETVSATPAPTFADLPLGPALQRAVGALGYTTPTPIQAEAIAPLVEGHDLIGQAAT